MESMAEFPDLVQEQADVPTSKLRERAFYAAVINGVDPVTDYRNAAADIELNGQSALVDMVSANFEAEQDEFAKHSIASLIADPQVSVAEKQNALYLYKTRGYLTKDIREKYKEQVASQDNAVTNKDRRAQDVWIQTMQGEDENARQLQIEKDNIGASFNPSAVGVVAGVLRDIIPGVALGWNVSVAKTASQTGVDESWYERAKSFMFSGSGNAAIAEHYKKLPSDKKIEFIKRIAEVYKTNPSFDFNTYVDFMTQVEDPNGPVLTLLEDAASVFNIIGLGGIWKTTQAATLAGRAAKFLKIFKYEGVYKPKIIPVEPPPSGPMYSGKAHAPTGDLAKEIEKRSTKRASVTIDQAVEAEKLRLSGPTVDPLSPAGTTATAAKEAGQNLGASIVADTTGEFASAAGTTRGAIISDWLLPKIGDELGKAFPDIRDRLVQLDRYMQDVYRRNEFDPFLLPVTKMAEEKEKIMAVLNETTSPVYHQATSTFSQTSREISGSAYFGRNATHGFDSVEEALAATEKLERAISLKDNTLTRGLGITEKDGQIFIKWDYSKPYDFFDEMMFGEKAISAKFKLPIGFGKEVGVNLDWLARSPLGFLISPVQKFDQWVVKGNNYSQYRTAKVEHDFIREIRDNIFNVKDKDALFEVLNYAQENQRYLTPTEIREMFPTVSSSSYKEVVKANEYYKRLVDYQYNWANRFDKAAKASGGYKAIYSKLGELQGYGTTSFPTEVLNSVGLVWDMHLGKAVPKPGDMAGRIIVRVENGVNDGANNIYEFAIADKLDPLPAHTLPKIEGYVPRKNVENWYVTATPKELNINGNKIDGQTVDGLKKLREHSRVVGAGDKATEARLLAARMQEEFPDYVLDIKKDKGDTAEAILQDYKIYKEVLDYSKKRGARLPTLNGFARLEDPLIALIDSVKTTVRMDAWKDYKDVFRTNFMKRYAEFVTGHEFPAVLGDLQLPKNASPEAQKEFARAVRLFEYFTKTQYHEVLGDRYWREAFNALGEVMEKLPGTLHRAPKEVAEWGNLFAKLPKSIASHLFLYLNPLRQPLVQTQQLLELAVIDKVMAEKVGLNIAPVMLALMDKAQAYGATSLKAGAIKTIAKSVTKVFGKQLTPLKMEDFDEVVEAIYESGLMHSVDLNMMLHGMVSDVQRPLKESIAHKGLALGRGIISGPGKVGKSVGYSPAELANQVGLWMFEKEQWVKNNPGKSWNTPETISQITTGAWERGHAMATTANAMWYQEGFLSTFTQFMKVQEMAFMQLFSAKGLSPNDRLKLAASRVLLFGVSGVPAGALIDAAFEKYGDEDTVVEYKQWKQGVLNWFTNATINQLLPEESQTALNFADSMSPISKSHPYLEFMENVVNAFDADPYTNPRFAAWAATTSFGQSIRDMWTLYRTEEIESVEDFKLAAYEGLKSASGWNNFAKAMYMKQFNDIASKFGTDQGIEFTRAEIFFQLAGIQSQKLLDNYELGGMVNEKKAWIRGEAESILSDLKRYRQSGYIETPEDFIKHLNKRASFVPEEIRQEVRDEVFRKDRYNFLDRTESEFLYLAQQREVPHNETLKKMRATIKAGQNDKAKKLLEELDSVRDGE